MAPESSSFQAALLIMSVAVLVFITFSVGFAGVKYLRRTKSVDLEADKKGKLVF